MNIFLCYQKVLRRFRLSDEWKKRKWKAYLWFLIKSRWVCNLDRLFKENSLDYVLVKHPFLYYSFRMHTFMKKGVGEQEILQWLFEHYVRLHKVLGRKQVEALFEEGVGLFSQVIGGHQISVKLVYDHRMRFEGQLTLKLCLDDMEIYYIHFLLHRDQLWIGGLQGVAGMIENNKVFTKITSGLRPQNFLMFILFCFAQKHNISMIKAVSSRGHVYQNEMKSKEKIRFDYDAFWRELGGNEIKADSEWFQLSIRYPQKPLEEIKTKKRSLYRKRYALMEQIEHQLLEVS